MGKILFTRERWAMYHPCSKNDPHIRKALYEAYSNKCSYCGDLIQPKNMHVDHILATNAKKSDDSALNQYIDELMDGGFVLDSIENYRLSCAACNLKKGNRNINVANLRFYHSEAKQKAQKVLAIMSQFKDRVISFDEFNPNYDYWEQVDFSYQKDISEAIAGYRLQPCHVCACPRLVQVEEIKKRLDIVDYVIIEGEPGCGKSISIYQAAFDLSSQGYTVYRYINKNAEETIYIPKSDEKKHLIIIDDAQNLPQASLEQIVSQSNTGTKVILAFTQVKGETASFSEPIRITNFDAVKAIAQDYRKRKQEILPIVQKFDNTIGDSLWEIPFERRVKNAATKNTPWLFNYTLRGGWSTTNAQFQSVYNHNKCGLLSAAIALFQVLKLDSAIDFNCLQTYVLKFDEKIIWTEDDLAYLIRSKLIASPDDVRIVHIESAKSLLRSFYKIADDASKQLISKILEEGYRDRLFTEQGLIWLQDAVFSSAYYLREQIFTESLLDLVFSNLDAVTDEERRGNITYFLEQIFNLRQEKNGRYYFKKHEHEFVQWISRPTSKNAYAYSRLLNALNNERDGSLQTFVSKVNLTELLQNFSDSSVEELFDWCKLIERMAYAYNAEERGNFGELLRMPLVAKSQAVTTKNIAIFYLSMTELFLLNEGLVLELLTNNIEVFKQLCLTKVEEAIEVFDFHFLEWVCGLSHFSPRKPTSEQRAFAKKFVGALPVVAIADYISNSFPRDWQGIFDIGRLLYRENKRIYSKIVKALDLEVLNKRAALLWKKPNRELQLLFTFIACGDRVSAQKFFSKNKHKVEELGLTYIEILPEEAIELFNEGVKLRLFDECWNDATFGALSALNNTSDTAYKRILKAEALQVADKISSHCILDFKKSGKTLTEILKYIKDTYPTIIAEIVLLLDFEKMKNGRTRILGDDRCDKKCKKQFNAMIEILIESSDENRKSELESLKILSRIK